MKISNSVLEVELVNGKLRVVRLDSGAKIALDWPACAVSIDNQPIIPVVPFEDPKIESHGISQKFSMSNMIFEVEITLSDACWFRKDVRVARSDSCGTVDYIDVDVQELDDNLKRCGYIPTSQNESDDSKSEEEGVGFVAGCGYPLIGKEYFVGLEHPAAFNVTEDGRSYRLRHFPQWNGDILESVGAVFGWSDEPADSFMEYLDDVRHSASKKPLISFCSFWSDPYIGNYEYAIHYDNYLSFFDAFAKLGLTPDVFTLDAGWNDRQSVFGAKADMNGDHGLHELRERMKANGVDLSLWVSHNGPMGIAPEYMKSHDMSVGKGPGAAYSSGEYGVMIDEKFEKALTESFCRLIRDFKAIHLKIDWDNECACNADYVDAYPTVNHVRQSSIDAMARIAEEIWKVNPEVVIRNGWWTSPWWLCHANHLWLCDSGDSEYASMPSRNQRESASTHRDSMYYAVLRRDESMIPLECFDNHEFPDALRNPFVEEPVSWTNALWMSFMRGSTYMAYTLQPEKLENWQIESFSEIMSFCRENSEHIFVKRGRMVGGKPSKGEIYGFTQYGEKETWSVLRNPLPVPQMFNIENCDFKISHAVESILQFYPNYKIVSDEIFLPAHGIVLLIFDSKKRELPFSYEFMTTFENGEYRNYFPSTLNVDNVVRPLINEMYQIGKLEVCDVCRRSENKTTTITFKVRCPYRMRDFEAQIAVRGADASQSSLKMTFSRYALAEVSRYAMPVSEYRVNDSGHGEKRNPDLVADQNQKYFSVRLPDGGESYYKLEINSVDFDQNDVEIWLAGYEAPSRNSIVSEKAPLGFENVLPYQHPLGFPKQIKVEI